MIVCKGFKKDGKDHTCGFIFWGDWGAPELVDHQRTHEAQEDGKTYFWLGFETKRSFDKLSGRDGKN